MPKVKITETDNTGSVQLGSTSNVVYIPGVSKTSNVAPKLYTSVKEFDNDKDLFIEENSFKLARRLLQLGMQVLYEGCEGTDIESEEQEFSTKILQSDDNYSYFNVLNSDIDFILDGDTVKFKLTSTDDYQVVDIVGGVADFTGSGIEIPENVITTAVFDYASGKVVYTRVVATSATGITAPDWSRLQDLNEYDIRFLTTGAYVIPSTYGAMINCACRRGDCTALVDTVNYLLMLLLLGQQLKQPLHLQLRVKEVNSVLRLLHG